MSPPSVFLEALARAAGTSAVSTDPDNIEMYRRDQTAVLSAGMPVAVVFPRSTSDVQAVVRVCTEFAMPIVPRGAGSGLAGGANAVDGCVVLCLDKMDRIVGIDPQNLVAIVEPAVITANLDAACRAHGLAYPPDPSSRTFSTIGGNIATNAGGLCCVKYGVTADYVLALEAVLADGSVIRTGRTTRKGVAGYDLTRLFVGSEGTLGIITQATLRIVPAPGPASTLVASFAGLEAAGAAVTRIVSTAIPSLCELMDRTTISAIEAWRPLGLDTDAQALLVVQSDAPTRHAELDVVEALVKEEGASLIVRSTDPSEADLLLEARRSAYPALERLGSALLDDVAVPPARIPELLRMIEEIARRYGLTIGTFGHVGDGNMHPTIVFDPDTESEIALEAFDAIVSSALSLGGTVTGEHGVGALKQRYLRMELDPRVLSLHRSVKEAFDPTGILNPGKAF